MGLERALKGAKQPREILPPLTRALARDPRNPVLRAIELRTWIATGPGDSVSAAAQRWIALAPESAEPYRAWTQALIQDGKLDEAQRVLAQGVQRVGPAPLLPDQAQLSAARGQWLEAARQWHTAVQASDELTENATETLSQAPVTA